MSGRILVTGSRDWSDEGAIAGALWEAWVVLDGRHQTLTLVHGACPTGADQIAEKVWRDYAPKHAIETYPADWSKGRKAGPERNAAMVALGADLCLAFIGSCSSPRCDRTGEHWSHGATGCADLAEAADIATRRIYAGEPS